MAVLFSYVHIGTRRLDGRENGVRSTYSADRIDVGMTVKQRCYTIFFPAFDRKEKHRIAILCERSAKFSSSEDPCLFVLLCPLY